MMSLPQSRHWYLLSRNTGTPPQAEHLWKVTVGSSSYWQQVHLHLPSATIVSERVEVSVSEQIVLPAAVPERGLAVAGRILDADTLQPLAGAEVSCEPGSPSVFRAPDTVQDVPSVLSDTDGLFLLEGLDAGPCRAIIRAAGFATWRKDGI